MSDFIEIDFLSVETKKSGDAIAIRYKVGEQQQIHVVDGGYKDTGEKIIEHIKTHYASDHIDHVVLTHPDQDHANGLKVVLENFSVGRLWMNRPWIYASELIDKFETYESVQALEKKLRDVYSASADLERIAAERGIPISPALQGSLIGTFVVVAPSKARYLDLVLESDKTPKAVEEERAVGAFDFLTDSAKVAIAQLRNFVKAAWGDEYFPTGPTSRENEMSVVQRSLWNDKKILLTGDVGREGLREAIDYLKSIGDVLPGVSCFQVPHHGGRHNVSTELLDELLGERLVELPSETTWCAICSSAKEDEDHPRKSVVRAMMHRGAHWSDTEGRGVCWSRGISRAGWSSTPQAEYPDEQEGE